MKGIFEKKDLSITALQVKGFRGFPPMFHAHYEIIYVLEGTISMVIDEKPRCLHTGELSVSFPYSIHSYETSPEAKAIIILFAPAAAGAFEKTLLSCKPVSPYLPDTGALLPILNSICRHSGTAEPEREQTARAYLVALVGELLLSSDFIHLQETDLSTTQ